MNQETFDRVLAEFNELNTKISKLREFLLGEKVKELNNLKTLIKSFDSKAFIYINETKTIENGYIK